MIVLLGYFEFGITEIEVRVAMGPSLQSLWCFMYFFGVIVWDSLS